MASFAIRVLLLSFTVLFQLPFIAGILRAVTQTPPVEALISLVGISGYTHSATSRLGL